MPVHLMFKDKYDITHAVPFDHAVLKEGANLVFGEEVDRGVIRYIEGPLNEREFNILCSNSRISSVYGTLFGYGRVYLYPSQHH